MFDLLACMQDKDYLNNRYLFKRALYLHRIARALQGYTGVTDVHYALLNVRLDRRCCHVSV